MAHFTSHDGTAIVYDDEGDGTPVVMFHGFVGDSNVDWVRSGIFDRLIDEGFRVVLVDMRGHGRSGKPHDAEAYSGDAIPLDGAALLDELGISSCLVVGFSLGARTALRLASLDARVTAVVLLGLGELSLRPATPGANPLSDAMLVDDPATIEHRGLRSFRRMADAINADRQAMAATMSADWLSIPEFTDAVKVPVLVINGIDDTSAGAPEPLADLLVDARAMTTAGNHAGVKDQAITHEAVVAFLHEHS